MPEDLNISDEQNEAEDAAFEWPTPHDDINAAFNAYTAVCDVDTKLMSKAEARRIERIKKLSLKIIYKQILYIHDCVFEVDTKEEEEDE